MTISAKIALGIAIAAALGVAGFYGFKDGTQAVKQDNETVATTTAQSEDTGKKVAFEQLAKQGGTHKCTVTQTVGPVTSQGTVYMDKGLIRGEFAADYSGQKINIYFIMRDGFTYTWNSMMPTLGYKIKNDTTVPVGNVNASASGTITPNSPNGYLDQIGAYDCTEWTANASFFTPPTTVTFKAMN